MTKKGNSVTGLILTQKGDVKESKLTLDTQGQLTEAGIKKLVKGKGDPEIIGTYPFKDGESELILFGYMDGKAGSENKHELPPPNDGITVFGDILVIEAREGDDWSNPIPLKVSDYERFYAKAFGSMDDEDGGEVEAEAETEAEAEAEPDVEAESVIEEGELDGDESDEGDEEELDEEGEEEEGEEDGGEVEVEVEGEGIEDTPARVRAHRSTKAKVAKKASTTAACSKRTARKTAAAATALAAAAVATYANYLHVDQAAELQMESPQRGVETLPSPRLKVVRSLTELFKDQLKEDEIRALERAIYNGTIASATERHIGKTWSHPPFIELYRMHAKHIAANFHPGSYVGNTELFQKFKDGTISIDELAFMDSYQLFEGRWRDNFVQQQAREKRQLEGNKAMATDRFLCTRCWKRECTYYEMQTRSADEPMTIFITCLNCGKHWRQ